MGGLSRQPLSPRDQAMVAQIAKEKLMAQQAAQAEANASIKQSAFAPKADNRIQAAIAEERRMNSIGKNPVGAAIDWFRR